MAAHDAKAARRWRSYVDRRTGREMNPQALEAAVMRLARTNPEYVVMGA